MSLNSLLTGESSVVWLEDPRGCVLSEGGFLYPLIRVYCGTMNSQWHTQKSSQAGQEIGVWRVSEDCKGSRLKNWSQEDALSHHVLTPGGSITSVSHDTA